MGVVAARCWFVVVCGLAFGCGGGESSAESCPVSAADALAGDGRSLTSLSLGPSGSCAVANDGSLFCWGGGKYTPERVPLAGSVLQVAVGAAAKCAIRPGGS